MPVNRRFVPTLTGVVSQEIELLEKSSNGVERGMGNPLAPCYVIEPAGGRDMRNDDGNGNGKVV